LHIEIDDKDELLEVLKRPQTPKTRTDQMKIKELSSGSPLMARHRSESFVA